MPWRGSIPGGGTVEAMGALEWIVAEIERGLGEDPPFSRLPPPPRIPTESEIEALGRTLLSGEPVWASAPTRDAAERALKAAQDRIVVEAHLRHARCGRAWW